MAKQLIKIDKNGTKYYVDNVCPKCDGKGYISYYNFNEGGMCFKCNGTGTHITKWKEYTEEYQKILDEKRLQKYVNETSEYNHNFLLKNNFNEDGKTYVVTGDTYSIKDQIKADGGKYDSGLGWHFTDNNTKYNCIEIDVDEVTYKDNVGRYSLMQYYDIKDVIKSKTKEK